MRRAAVTWWAGLRAGLPIVFWIVIGFLFGAFTAYVGVVSVLLLTGSPGPRPSVVVVVVTAVVVLIALPPFLYPVRRVGVALGQLLIGLPAATPAHGLRATLLGALWYVQHMVLGCAATAVAFWAYPLGVAGLFQDGALEELAGRHVARPAGLALFVGVVVLILIAPAALRALDRYLTWSAARLLLAAPDSPAPAEGGRPGVFTYRSEERAAAALPTLTAREQEVLALVAEGRRNADIAAALVVSPETVKSHVSSILMKLGVENRTQAAALWLAASGQPSQVAASAATTP
jgi:DNA-binding CsgD family transcriptional regulator